MELLPKWKLNKDGHFVIAQTEGARRIKQTYKIQSRTSPRSTPPKLFDEYLRNAAEEAASFIVKLVLSYIIMQYGQYTNKHVKWIVENDPGYAMYMCRVTNFMTRKTW